MFTGIIEFSGTVASIEENGSNKTFWIESGVSNQLKTDESLSHDGVCLTIEATKDNTHKVTAIKETLLKTNILMWAIGTKVNLERPLLLTERLHGHLVQGHIDTTAICISKQNMNGSAEFTFKFDKKFTHLIIEKGSICVNGVSLTAFNVTRKKFTVAIIPYTLEHTNLSEIEAGARVNIEFDILGKYVQRAYL